MTIAASGLPARPIQRDPRMSRLDILLPHFEDTKGLALSLASIAEQTWPGDIRIVIVDDGSSRHEFRGVEALAARQTLPVELMRNPENRGRPYTRNRLLDSRREPLRRLARRRRRLVPDEAASASSSI